MSAPVEGRARRLGALLAFSVALSFGPMLLPGGRESLGWLGVIARPIRHPSWPATSAVGAALALGGLATGLIVRRSWAWGFAFLGGFLWSFLVLMELADA